MYSREEAQIGILECSERDAAHVLDGPLYHESELAPEEHYTDTHGYTACNFAAFAMPGKRFCPRIRGLKKQRIHHADPERGYGAPGDMLSGARRRLRLDWIEKHWDEIAQLVASFAHGHTTASTVMQRLVSFGAKNRLYPRHAGPGAALQNGVRPGVSRQAGAASVGACGAVF